VVVTLHVAWASEQAMQDLWDQVIANIENFHRGKPSNLVS
jgi:glycerate dehydrogenase